MYRQIKLSTGLRNKFPMPESRKEQGLAIFLIGLAIFFASAFDPMRDIVWKINGDNSSAQLVRHEQYKKSGPKRVIGIYEYSDNAGGRFEVSGKTIYDDAAKIPKDGQVAWKLGEPQNARLLGDYTNRIMPIFMGLFVMGFGIYIFFKTKKAI